MKEIILLRLFRIIFCCLVFAYLNYRSFPLSGSAVYFFIFLALIICCWQALLLIRNKTAKQVTSLCLKILAGLVFAVLAFISLYLFKTGTASLTNETVNALFQSNPSESFEFLTFFFSGFELAIIAISFLIPILLIPRHFKISDRKIPAAAAVAALSIPILIFFVLPKNNLYSSVAKAKKEYSGFIDILGKYEQIKAKRFPDLKAVKKQKGEIYLLVIGESANKNHLGAYGYFRDTTPWASYEKKENPNSIFFENAYANYVHTVKSLTYALTSLNRYAKNTDYVAPTLIDTVKASGFNVVWLSNQSKVGIWENPVSLIADAADKKVFLSGSDDSAILPVFNKALKELDLTKNNLIIVHLMGSHHHYAKRLPKNFNPDFKSSYEDVGIYSEDKRFLKDYLNAYDASILHTDNNLKSLHEAFFKLPNLVKFFFYFSDHGEDVLNKKRHDPSLFTHDMMRIPAFAVFSEGYKREYKDKIKTLQNRTDAIFTNDLVFNFMLGIMDIDTPLNSQILDISSKDYAVNLSNALMMREDDFVKDASKAVKINSDSFIASKENLKYLKSRRPEVFFAAYHTDNALSVYNILTYGFNCIETALFPKHKFDIKRFLNIIPLKDINEVRINLTNLNDASANATAKDLQSLNLPLEIRKKMVIITSAYTDGISQLYENGWKVSFYLRERQPLAKNLQFKDLSFNNDLYDYVKTSIEPSLPQNINYSVYFVRGNFSIQNGEGVKNMLQAKPFNDSRVKTIVFK